MFLIDKLFVVILYSASFKGFAVYSVTKVNAVDFFVQVDKFIFDVRNFHTALFHSETINVIFVVFVNVYGHVDGHDDAFSHAEIHVAVFIRESAADFCSVFVMPIAEREAEIRFGRQKQFRARFALLRNDFVTYAFRDDRCDGDKFFVLCKKFFAFVVVSACIVDSRRKFFVGVPAHKRIAVLFREQYRKVFVRFDLVKIL